MRIPPKAPANLAGRVGQCLTEWTGQRWVVTVSSQQGEPTLAEQDKEVENKRRDRALSHPLTQAVLLAFPDAKMTALRQREIAPTPASGDDAPEGETVLDD